MGNIFYIIQKSVLLREILYCIIHMKYKTSFSSFIILFYEIVVYLPMAELVYLTLFTVISGAPNTQSARQMPKYCFLVRHTYVAYATFRSTGSPRRSIDSQSSLPPTSSII
jgi:hypothetical protein